MVASSYYSILGYVMPLLFCLVSWRVGEIRLPILIFYVDVQSLIELGAFPAVQYSVTSKKVDT